MNISNFTSAKKIEDVTKEKNKNIIKIIKGSIISIVITIIALTIYAAVLSYTNISESTMIPVILTITGISILIGSSMSSISIKKQGMINGGLVGLIYILFIYILSSIISTGFSLNMNAIIMILVAIVTGIIGGIIGVNLGN